MLLINTVAMVALKMQFFYVFMHCHAEFHIYNSITFVVRGYVLFIKIGE